MAVIATPTSHPLVQCCDNSTSPQDVLPVSCVGQNVVAAPVSAQNGQPVLTRMRAVSLMQGQCGVVEWQMIDRDGVPVNLAPCNLSDPESPLKVVLRLKEQISLGNNRPVREVAATVSDAATGKVSAQLSAGMVDVPGVYYGEMALVNMPEQEANRPCVIFSNTFYVIINRGTFELRQNNRRGGPPSIAEIRLHLRDSSPAESYLLEHLMFDDAEIALAITRPVQFWNEVPPPLSQMYSTQNFPYRYHWLEGICANLFLMVAEQFRRNQLSYQAGGVALDDQNKEGAYERAGQMRWQAYRDWVRGAKASINLESCYGEVSSNYKYSAYTDAIRIRY